MKRLAFFVFTMFIFGGCGGGDRSGGTVNANLTVQPQDSQGNITAGRSVNLAGGGINMTCFQEPGSEVPGTVDPKCSTSTGQSGGQGGGQAVTLIVFTDLPTEEVYTLTEQASTGTTTAICNVLLNSSTSLTVQDGPCQQHPNNPLAVIMTVS